MNKINLAIGAIFQDDEGSLYKLKQITSDGSIILQKTSEKKQEKIHPLIELFYSPLILPINKNLEEFEKIKHAIMCVLGNRCVDKTTLSEYNEGWEEGYKEAMDDIINLMKEYFEKKE